MTNSISILTPLQQMRLRPGMYIGDTSGPDTLLKELIDNAIDEMLNNYATRIDIDWNYDEGWYRVRDNGRGLPLTKFETTDLNTKHLNGEISAKLLFTREFSSGKYDKSNYPYSSGLNGVGIKACNVFSTKVIARVKDVKNVHNGQVYNLELGWDKLQQKTKEEFTSPDEIEDFWWSTEITLWPDMEVFRSVKCKVKEIQLQLAKTANPDVTINVNGQPIEAFSFKNLVDTHLLMDKELKTKVKYGTLVFDITFGWSTDDFKTYLRGSVNLGQCNDGWHIRQVRNAIGTSLSQINDLLSNTDADYGLRVFINALVSEPVYTSQTKEKISLVEDFNKFNENLLKTKYKDLITVDPNTNIPDTKEAQNAARNDPNYETEDKFSNLLVKEITKELNSNEEYTQALTRRIVEYKKSVQRLSDQQYIDSIIKTGNDRITRNAVSGITDCSSSQRDKCELYICEGKSAEGPIKSTRNKLYQAVFALRGKPLNAANTDDIKSILENKEMKTMINGIGVGLTPNVNLEHARYGKIIIATDADSDGLHIQGLLLGALAYLCPEVLKAGMVYLAKSPLYKQGDTFVYDDKDLDLKKDFDRYKGLGSWEKEDLAKAIVYPDTRRLVKIEMHDNPDRVLEIVTQSSEKKRIMINSGLLVQ